MGAANIQVYLKINDTDSPFHMKVGDTGEAFFVFETDQDVPADMQTSPITGPIQDEELGEDVSAICNVIICIFTYMPSK